MEYIFFTVMCIAVGLFGCFAAYATSDPWILIPGIVWLLGAYVPYSLWRDNRMLEEDERLDRIPGEKRA
jgi:hypothetical protein